jgi:hypothetical protein
MAELKASRWSAGLRSRTLGCWTSTAPMPVWMARSGEVAVADDLTASLVVLEMGMVVDPGGDLGLDGLGQQTSGSVPQEVGEPILAGGQGHDSDLGRRLTHGGVLLGLVGHMVGS